APYVAEVGSFPTIGHYWSVYAIRGITTVRTSGERESVGRLLFVRNDEDLQSPGTPLHPGTTVVAVMLPMTLDDFTRNVEEWLGEMLPPHDSGGPFETSRRAVEVLIAEL